MIILYKYNDVGNFSEGFAKVSKNNKHGFIDKGDNQVTDFKYDYVSDFRGEFAEVEFNRKSGYITKMQ